MLYNRLLKKAGKLVSELQNDITVGKKIICENYGQKEIGRFINKEINSLSGDSLSYQEKCSIKEVLYKVSSIC